MVSWCRSGLGTVPGLVRILALAQGLGCCFAVVVVVLGIGAAVAIVWFS